jgi:peptidylprolyl isomerase
LAVAAASVFALAGCGSSCSTCEVDPADLTFAPFLGVNLATMTKTASGLYYQDLVVGQGEEAFFGDSLRVHYTGWLHDGTEFDSSEGGEPRVFQLNSGLIAAWQEGVPGMREGGKRKLVVPPTLGYGKNGVPGAIPGNATLVFDIQLIDRW